jgi:ATP-dependent helicase YprA (DUF1998 family)
VSATIQQTIDELRQTLTDYIEATYHVGHPTFVEQRKRLLAEAGGIYQRPYLESTPRYVLAKTYAEMTELPAAAREAFLALADPENGKPVIYDPPYTHQAQAIHETLVRKKNLMIMTGTGSGKTESFLLPILGKFAIEARDRAAQFQNYSAVRAMILYPMNALVNDQLGRLRLLFGNPRVVSMFESWAGRPARFSRYTSRTPYAGVRTPTKDGRRLGSIEDFFVDVEQAAHRHEQSNPIVPEEDARAFDLHAQFKRRGKWPAKPSIESWFGTPHQQWRNRQGAFQRAVMGPHDAELLTRHEVQASPPDLLITNYSMLEYMMMRPIERTIFEKTRRWLRECPNEKFMIVLDEAHLYRGAQGAEVGLLLRRLRERLGIGVDQFQVICATASFSEAGRANAGHFGAQLAGVPEETFVPITGSLALREPEAPGGEDDVAALEQVDLKQYYSDDPTEQRASVERFLTFRGVAGGDKFGEVLTEALSTYPPFNHLVNATMRAAVPLPDLGGIIFPGIERERADRAVTSLLALGSRARTGADEASLLPCRIHSFFRGLPGLWVCMDSGCTELATSERGGPAGKLYDQPRKRCGCGAPILEYFTCRYCGTSYARAYTNDVTSPQLLWAEPGKYLRTDAGGFEALEPLDLLLEEPSTPTGGLAAEYDLVSGMLNSAVQGRYHRRVYIRPPSNQPASNAQRNAAAGNQPGTFAPCACCKRLFMFGQSSIQDHQTKGDQPFQSLLGTQLRVQPPGPQPATEFAPLRGRKVLIFSDSRQVAARLAPTLQNYSLQDTVRALLPIGFSILARDPQFSGVLTLDHAFLAVVVAAHRFGVRVRPELETGEFMPRIDSVPMGQVPSGSELVGLISTPCPANLMRAIVQVLTHKDLGLEALAIASVSENDRRTSSILSLPSLPGLAEDDVSKLAVARAWLRCWMRGTGAWFSAMPPSWWGTEVTSHLGSFADMNHVLTNKAAKKDFNKHWLPRLKSYFSQTSPDGGTRLMANQLALAVGGEWRRCPTCKSVHRAIPLLATCIDCEAQGVEEFDPLTDAVFKARRGFYRQPVIQALTQTDPSIMSLIAAEHTAQLNAAQPEDAFSKAENHELRFQDINVAWRDTDPREPAIDVLSSTTTMEVGIDIGELSGVALRNMPPGRANYQQRAGRAGRRGNAVATVVAFGSSDSHDDHYFSAPDEMIRGSVIDPRLTLENADIARRHLRAYLLQRYHEDRLPDVDPAADPNLFSVLGNVRDFRSGTGILNRDDFVAWLNDNRGALREAVDRWLPSELSLVDRQNLLDTMAEDVVREVDSAVQFVGPGAEGDDCPIATATVETEVNVTAEVGSDEEDETEVNEDDDTVDPTADKLLDRLLYWGVLPRYAFPIDVAAFYVFNRALSTPHSPKMDFAPSQGLNVALSQYAPNKQIWIRGKQYTSKAIYSPYKNERRNAWGRKKLYFECSRCSHAKTETFVDTGRGSVKACEACLAPATFGPAKTWFRPPGFAHPIDLNPVTTPDAPNETAYATRAKLIMQTPGPNRGWLAAGERMRSYPLREHLLVSNTGPEGEGYHYCVACGRIEAVADRSPDYILSQPHTRPYPNNEEGPCPGRVSRGVVLGTDFRTDIALFSLPFDAPFRVRPGNDETSAALRTVCEAMATASCRLLQIEPGEVLAEYRPALTEAGALGLEAEIFIYDTLAGGAGFSPQLVHHGAEVIEEAIRILEICPSNCDASCYRCLRSFRNKLDHRHLDRQLGEQLLRHSFSGGYPDYPAGRAEASLNTLFADLERQFSATHDFERHAARDVKGRQISVPIIIRNRELSRETWVDLHSPISPETPVHEEMRRLDKEVNHLICIDDLLVRHNLPRAVEIAMGSAA